MLLVRERAYPFKYKVLRDAINYKMSISDYTKESPNDIIENQFSQDIKVDFYGANKEFEFQINVTNATFDLDPKINYQKSFIEKLSKLTQSVEALVNGNGDIVDIRNYRKVLEKWNDLKIEMSQNNKGTLIDAYLKQIDDSLKDKVFFIQNLRQYRLFGLLFNRFLDIPFDNRSYRIRERIFEQAIRSIPISINEKVELVKEEQETDLLEYKLTGSLNPLAQEDQKRVDAYLKHFNMAGSTIYLEDYSGTYKVNKYTAWIENANVSLKLTNGRGYQRNVEYILKKVN